MYRSRRALALVLPLGAWGLAACGGRDTATLPVPVQPENAIHDFMEAVSGNDLDAMANLWGSSRGPASTYMGREELQQRLTVIQVYLDHESYEILPPGLSAAVVGREREFSIRLLRSGCRPTIPFKVVQYREGWLVSEIDLAAAGNPARTCPMERSDPGS